MIVAPAETAGGARNFTRWVVRAYDMAGHHFATRYCLDAEAARYAAAYFQLLFSATTLTNRYEVSR